MNRSCIGVIAAAWGAWSGVLVSGVVVGQVDDPADAAAAPAASPDRPTATDAEGGDTAPDATIGELSLVDRGHALLDRGRVDEAVATFRKAVAQGADEIEALNGLGWALFEQGVRHEAERVFLRALKMDPRNAEILNGLGWTYFEMREHEKEAEEYWLKSAKLEANSSWGGLVNLYLLQKRWDEALKWAQRVDERFPERRGTNSSSLEAARAHYLPPPLRHMIQRERYESPLARRGWRWSHRGNLKRAQEAFRAATNLDHTDPSANCGKGFVFLREGKLAAAETAFLFAQRSWPHDPILLDGMAQVAMARGNVQRAIALWTDAHENSVVPGFATRQLAHLYMRREEYAQAVKYFKLLVEAYPGNPDLEEPYQEARRALHEQQENDRTSRPDGEDSSP